MNWALITTELVWSASSTGNIKRCLKLGENTRKALSRDRMLSQFLEFFSVKLTVLDKRPQKYGLLVTDVRDRQTTAISTVESLHNSQRAKVTTKVEVTRKVIGAKVTRGAIVAMWVIGAKVTRGAIVAMWVIGAKDTRGAIVARWPLQEVEITVNVSAGTKNVASAICNIAVQPDYRGRYRRKAM